MEVKTGLEEKKGAVKITIEIEINEALMEAMKESMTKMQDMWAMKRKAKESEA